MLCRAAFGCHPMASLVPNELILPKKEMGVKVDTERISWLGHFCLFSGGDALGAGTGRGDWLTPWIPAEGPRRYSEMNLL